MAHAVIGTESCKAGKYNKENENEACMSCPAGKYSDTEGASDDHMILRAKTIEEIRIQLKAVKHRQIILVSQAVGRMQERTRALRAR